MAFPPAHFLVGVGVAELVRSAAPLPRWKAWLAAGLLALLPDADFAIGLVNRFPSQYHGTFTHSLTAVAVVAALAWAVAGGRWAALAGAGYGSHLLVDLLDDRGRTNVLLGWPFTDEQPYAIAKVFPLVTFEQGRGVIAAAASLLQPSALRALAEQTLVGAAIMLLLFLLGFTIRRLRASLGAQLPSARSRDGA